MTPERRNKGARGTATARQRLATIEELLEAVFSARSMPFSLRSVPRLHREDQRDKPVSSAVESLQCAVSRSSEVGVRWSPACEDVCPEAEERPPLEAVTIYRDSIA
jgi:hypothetical protein